MSKKFILFVYGTLMKDRRNSYKLKNEKFIGIGILKGYAVTSLHHDEIRNKWIESDEVW